MYQNQFQIIIQSKVSAIEQIISAVDLPEDSGVTINTVGDYHQIWKEDMLDDAVILDLNECNLTEAPEGVGTLVYLVTAEEISAISTELLDKAGMLWVMPGEDKYKKELLISYYKKLLNRMKESADYRKQRVCFETVIDSLPDLIWFKDRIGAHLIVNDGFCDAVEKTKEQIYKKGHYYIWDIPKQEYEEGDYVCLESEDIVIDARKTCLFDEKVKTKKGMRLFKTYKSPLIDDNGEIFGTCGVAHDVTELKNMSTELEVVLKNLPFSVAIEDSNGQALSYNDEFKKTFDEKEIADTGSFEKWKRQIIEQYGVKEGNFVEITLNIAGEDRIYIFREVPIIDVFEAEIGKVNIFQDITIARKAEEQTRYIARTDFLTGLSNRWSMFQYLDEKNNSEQITMITADLDNFKQVNDIYGHQSGDRALIETSRMLKESFPSDFIARLGGDEFLIVSERILTNQDIEKELQHMMNVMHEFYTNDPEFGKLSVSIGTAVSISENGKGHDFEELMHRSDAALYEAKQAGKDAYILDKSIGRS